jgi:hypothetical protein
MFEAYDSFEKASYSIDNILFQLQETGNDSASRKEAYPTKQFAKIEKFIVLADCLNFTCTTTIGGTFFSFTDGLEMVVSY